MLSACENIYLFIFELMSLGTNRGSVFFKYFLLSVNLSIPTIVLSLYLMDGNLFISFDALSKATDIAELSFPLAVHFFVTCHNANNQKIFSEMHKLIAELNELFMARDAKYFKACKLSFIISFTIKFFIVHSIGMGIEIFTMLTLIPGNTGWRDAIRTRSFSLNLVRLTQTQFMFYCGIICYCFNCFNHELESTIKILKDNKDQKFILQKLKLLKMIDLKIVSLSHSVRDYFKWMLLFAVTSDIAVIVIDIYWIYGGLSFASNPFFMRKFSIVNY